MENKPYIPIFNTSPYYLSDPGDILDYILIYFCHAPANSSYTYRNEEISLVKLVAEYGDNNELLRQEIISKLKEVILNYFPNASINIDVNFVSKTVKEILKELQQTKTGYNIQKPYIPPSNIQTQFEDISINITVTINNEVYTAGVSIAKDNTNLKYFRLT